MVQENVEVTLQQMLDFRERKVNLLQQYRTVYKNCTLVSLGLNVPGLHKTNEKIIQFFLEAKDRLESMFEKNPSYFHLFCFDYSKKEKLVSEI